MKKHIQVFLAEKDFIGCDGLVVTDEMRVTIAALACLLILNRKTDCYPNLHQVLVYPGAFMVDMEESDEAGVVQHERHVLSGESWSQSQVILSWEDVVEGAAVIDDGYNVVIHEFAHQLDQEKRLCQRRARSWPAAATMRSWSRVLGEEFERLRARQRGGRAVPARRLWRNRSRPSSSRCSGGILRAAALLQEENPALYAELSRFFCVSPVTWHPHGRQPLATESGGRSRLLEREADLERNLPVRDLAVGDVTAGFGHLEPVDVAHRLVRLGNSLLHRVLDADGRGTGQFQQLVDVYRPWQASLKSKA